jgi:hypothetical protein
LQVNDEVDVLPNTVVILYVVGEPLFGVSFQYWSVDSADEAVVFDIVKFVLGCISQLGEGIDNNTENNVEQDCDNDQEESQIKDSPEVETLTILFDGSLCGQILSNTSTTSNTIVDGT